MATRIVSQPWWRLGILQFRKPRNYYHWIKKKSLGNPETIITGCFLKKMVKNPMTKQQFVGWSPQKTAHDMMIFSRAKPRLPRVSIKSFTEVRQSSFSCWVSENGVYPQTACWRPAGKISGKCWELMENGDFMAIQCKCGGFPLNGQLYQTPLVIRLGNTPNIGRISQEIPSWTSGTGWDHRRWIQ